MEPLPVVRSIEKADVDALSSLAAEFEQYLDSLVKGRHNAPRMTRDIFLRDGFGERPGFYGIILDRDEGPCGYLLYCFGYNADLATRTLQVVDLFVKDEEQRKGFGGLLMRALIPICQADDIRAISVSVWTDNPRARGFYEYLGAESANEEVMWWPSEKW